MKTLPLAARPDERILVLHTNGQGRPDIETVPLQSIQKIQTRNFVGNGVLSVELPDRTVELVRFSQGAYYKFSGVPQAVEAALAKPIAKIVLRPILQGLKRVDLRLPQCAVVGGAVGPRVHYLSAQDKIAHLVLRVDTRLQEQEFFAIRAERSELPIDCLTPNAELAGDREPVLALLRTGCGARARARGRRQILFDRCGPSERIDRSSRDGHFHCPRRAFLGCCRKRREKR